jgi:hypothetical protein
MYTTHTGGNFKTERFQNKSLRRILDIPSTYIDRSYTNERMFTMTREQHGCRFETFRETWRKRTCKFLGHILRCHHSDTLHQIIFSHIQQNLIQDSPPPTSWQAQSRLVSRNIQGHLPIFVWTKPCVQCQRPPASFRYKTSSKK